MRENKPKFSDTVEKIVCNAVVAIIHLLLSGYAKTERKMLKWPRPFIRKGREYFRKTVSHRTLMPTPERPVEFDARKGQNRPALGASQIGPVAVFWPPSWLCRLGRNVAGGPLMKLSSVVIERWRLGMDHNITSGPAAGVVRIEGGICRAFPSWPRPSSCLPRTS